MLRINVLVLGLAALATPVRADNQMVQSPLLMRRAGPSCQPGNLGAEPGAGYGYRLGPCAGADQGDNPAPERPRLTRRARPR